MDFNFVINVLKNIYQKYLKKPLYYSKKYSKIIVLVLILLFLLYLIEKYIIYKLIYFVLYILLEKILPIIIFKNINLFSINFETILLVIYFHILLVRLIIISIVFLQGGIFRKFIVYEQFAIFISNLRTYLDNVIEHLNKNDQKQFKYLISKIKNIKKFYIKYKSTNMSFILKNYSIEDELNNMLDKYDMYIKEQDINKKDELIKSINALSGKMENFINFSIFEQIFKFKYTESLLLMDEYMINGFDTHIVEKVIIDKGFDIYILTPKHYNDNKILAIYCNQNALCCEDYAIGEENIEMYLYDLNCTIILWNYTGYGLRKGITTFGNVDKDVKILSKYIKEKFSDYKIIIHGCSIGGYSSIQLTKRLNDIDNIVLISDRTFGDIDKIVLSLYYGKELSILYNILFPKFLFHSNNVNDYISIPSKKKLICFDANDQIINYNPSSLVFNLTKKYYKDIIMPKINKYKEYKSLIEYPNNLVDELKKLAVDCNDKNFDKNGQIFLQHLNKYINSIEEFFMFFIIFGYPFNIFKEISYDSNEFNKNYLDIPIIIMNFVNKHKVMFSSKLLELIQIFNFLFVKFNLKTEISDNDIIKLNYNQNNKELFKFDDNFVDGLHKYFGYVRRIYCGHNGKLKDTDIKFIKGFLKTNKFIE